MKVFPYEGENDPFYKPPLFTPGTQIIIPQIPEQIMTANAKKMTIAALIDITEIRLQILSEKIEEAKYHPCCELGKFQTAHKEMSKLLELFKSIDINHIIT